MHAIAKIAFALLLASCGLAEARSPRAATTRHASHKDELIRLIADATAWSEFCWNYAINPVALAYFRDAHGLVVNGHYRAVYGFAQARQHAIAFEDNRFHQSCERALALYGPTGTLAPGLVRPLFNGTVRDPWIDLDRW